jgi:hypothetical protein
VLVASEVSLLLVPLWLRDFVLLVLGIKLWAFNIAQRFLNLFHTVQGYNGFDLLKLLFL